MKRVNLEVWPIFLPHLHAPRKYTDIWPSLAQVLHYSTRSLWQAEFSMRWSVLWLLLQESVFGLKYFSREVSWYNLGSSFILWRLLFPRASMNVFIDNISPWNCLKRMQNRVPCFHAEKYAARRGSLLCSAVVHPVLKWDSYPCSCHWVHQRKITLFINYAFICTDPNVVALD